MSNKTRSLASDMDDVHQDETNAFAVTNEVQVWKDVENYILDCPHVSPNHPAIRSALHGLEQERQRRERDAKLQQKFAKTAMTTDATAIRTDTNTIAATPTATTSVNVEKYDHHGQKDQKQSEDSTMMTDDDDWHDVNEDNKGSGTGRPGVDDGDVDGSRSYLGDVWASIAVRRIAQHRVKVMTPVAALAVAFHAALVSTNDTNKNNTTTFVCTGVPETGPAKGFAPPVRPLPPQQFLPTKWDEQAKSSHRVALRYRQEGSSSSSVGSMVLTVEQKPNSAANNSNNNKDNHLVQVSWIPAKQSTLSHSGEPSFNFVLDDHLNLDSWNRATHYGSVPAEPSLHYKALSTLLTRFVQTCDFGDAFLSSTINVSKIDNKINDAEHTTQQQQQKQLYVDATIQQLPSHQQTKATPSIPSSKGFHPPQPVLPQPEITTGPAGFQIPTTLQEAFPAAHHPRGQRGQFSEDLLPGGGLLIGGGGGDGMITGGPGGNLMGPNHPAFGGGGNGPFGGGGNGMGGFLQPRFDPYGPPPTQFDPNHPPHPSHRPTRGGAPNPDHLRPPNNLNHNMFS